MGDNTGNLTVVDAHVHLYDCFNLPKLFDGAYRNMLLQARLLHREKQFTAVLMLTETASDHYFNTLRAATGTEKAHIGDWHISPAKDEDFSLVCSKDSGETIIMIAGRQLVTMEGLEVLALGVKKHFDDGLPLDNALTEVIGTGALAVIPWAVGKWIGHRGKLLAELLESNQSAPFFLGDNSGRPVFWHWPSHFSLAARKGIAILPGSDPLPFSAEAGRIGSFGFTLNTALSKLSPGDNLKRQLIGVRASVQPYGKLERPLRFFGNQLRLRLGGKQPS